MGRTCAFVLGLLLALAAGSPPADLPAAEAPALADPRPVALTGALVRTQTDAGDFVGTVVIRAGKIVAVGPDVLVPLDAVRIDASKCVITPGLIDARGTLGLNAAAARETAANASLDILDAVDPFAEDWRDAARQGVTAVYAQPASNGLLGGAGAVLRVGPAANNSELAVRPQAGVQAALGTSGPPQAQATPPLPGLTGRGNPGPIVPAAAAPPATSTTLTRYAQYEQLRGQFESGKRYGESKPTRREAPKELLARAVKKEVPVFVEVGHEDDIRNALKLSTDFGLRAVFSRLDRAWAIPEEFAAARAPVVVGPFLGARSAPEVRKLALDGRRFAIGTFGDDPRATAGLRLHAAAAVAAGYPRDRVLRAVTADAADLLGVGDKLGRIAADRPADLVVFAGDPLDPSAPVRMTVCQGVVTYQAPAAEVAPSPLAAKPTLPDKLPPKYAIRTNRLLNAAGEFVPGSIYVADGRLTEPGPESSLLPTFNLGDAPVTAGLLAAHVAVSLETATDADAAHLRARDGLASDDGRLRGFRDAGFLSALVAPGSTNVIAGVPSLIRTADATAATDAGLKFVLTSSARDAERYPVSLGGQIELIGQRLGGAPSKTDMYLPPALRTSLLKMRDVPLEGVRGRKTTAYFEADTRAEVRSALRLIAEHKLRGVLLTPRQVEDLTDEIRSAGVAVIVGPQRPNDPEPVARGLVALGKAGVPLAFGGGSAAELRTSAAWLVNGGLPRANARRALAGQAGEALGLPAGTGQLRPGDVADFVVWNGDPIDTTSRPVGIVAAGELLAASGDAAVEGTGTRPGRAAPTPKRGRGVAEDGD